jgi:hypothetical protein
LEGEGFEGLFFYLKLNFNLWNSKIGGVE